MPYARKRNSAKRPYTKRPAYKRRPAKGRPIKAISRRTTAVVRPERPLIQKGFLPFARTFSVKLPYTAIFDITTSIIDTAVTHVFRLNSLFDPDQTLAGHQPMQYDQLTGMYHRYIVNGCKVNIEVNDPTDDGCYVGYAIYSGSNSGAAPGGKKLSEISEHRDTRMKRINNTGAQKASFSVYVPMHSLFGLPKMLYNNDRDQFSAPQDGNPGITAALVVFASALGATSVVTTSYRVNLQYYATMYDYQAQGQS